MSPLSLLSLTVHWLDVNYVPHSAMLNAKNFCGSHISNAIAALKEMLDKWKIPFSKVHVILRVNMKHENMQHEKSNGQHRSAQFRLRCTYNAPCTQQRTSLTAQCE